MFPIADLRGRVVAFGGRALERRGAGEVPELARYAALQQGAAPLQLPPRPQAGARARHGDRRRGLCRRDLAHASPGFPQRGRAPRHGPDGGPARAAVADGRRADPLLRRRQGRPPGRLPGPRRRPAEPAGRQVAALRAPAGRPGPGRPRPRGRRAGGRAGARLGAAPRRHPLGAGDRGRAASTRPSAGRPSSGACGRRSRRSATTPSSATTGRRSRARLSALGPEPRAGRFARGRGGPARPGGTGAGPAPDAGARLSVSPLLARSALFIGGPAETPARGDDPVRRPGRIPSSCTPTRRPSPSSSSRAAPRRRCAGSSSTGRRRARRPTRRCCRPGWSGPGSPRRPPACSALVRPGDRWVLDPHADPLRLEDALRQAITLHRRARTLHSELRAAERALAEEDNEANLAWLREVQNQLSSVEGAEADLDDSVVHRDP